MFSLWRLDIAVAKTYIAVAFFYQPIAIVCEAHGSNIALRFGMSVFWSVHPYFSHAQ